MIRTYRWSDALKRNTALTESKLASKNSIKCIKNRLNWRFFVILGNEWSMTI